MRKRPRFLTSGALLWLALAAAAQAQEVRPHILGANAARGVSGACMYGGDGKLLFAPKGAVCPEREQPPASLAPSAPQSPSPRRTVGGEGVAAPRDDASLTSTIRAEAAALFEERERLDVEIARAREALAYEDREAARRVVEAALAKITQHLEREARLLRQIATAREP